MAGPRRARTDRLRRIGRWVGIGAAIAAGLVAAAVPLAVGRLGGAYAYEPADLDDGLSDGARRLVDRAFADVREQPLVDHHVHVIGLGTECARCEVHPHMESWLHPVERLRFLVYRSAAGVQDADNVDRAYIDRLESLVQHFPRPRRIHLLAFDRNYHPDGRANPQDTQLYVPNDYVLRVAERHEQLHPTISVHPYRPDALEALERGAEGGARFVKWLPNAMGIDPSHERCLPFYRKMRELGLVLLTHAGEEQAMAAEGAQRFGNPLLLRAALDEGVRVVVAHCASLGTDVDLDDPDRPRVSSFGLFLRLMDEPRYEGLVFGEISAVTQYNRLPRPLKTLLERRDLHDRLVDGSDYPLPAVNTVIRTRALVERGFLTERQRAQLNEIYDYNPLLFDYVLKRTVRHPETGDRFAPSVFAAHEALR